MKWHCYLTKKTGFVETKKNVLNWGWGILAEDSWRRAVRWGLMASSSQMARLMTNKTQWSSIVTIDVWTRDHLLRVGEQKSILAAEWSTNKYWTFPVHIAKERIWQAIKRPPASICQGVDPIVDPDSEKTKTKWHCYLTKKTILRKQDKTKICDWKFL